MIKAKQSGWSVPYLNENSLVEVCFVEATER
jgi:hypothetical protein